MRGSGIHRSPSHAMTSALGHGETEAWETIVAPGEAQKAGVCPPTLWFLFAFEPPPSTARPRGGEAPTARRSAATLAACAHPTSFPWPCPDASALHPGTPGTVLSPLPGSARLAQHRPGTVRAGVEAKCIFGLGKRLVQVCSIRLGSSLGSFEPHGSFVPHY